MRQRQDGRGALCFDDTRIVAKSPVLTALCIHPGPMFEISNKRCQAAGALKYGRRGERLAAVIPDDEAGLGGKRRDGIARA